MNIPFEKSFASHPKSEFWSNKNGKIKPREIRICSGKKYWFDCKTCNHNFECALNNISAGKWCPYCCKSNTKLCDDINCVKCLNNSFLLLQKVNFGVIKTEK